MLPLRLTLAIVALLLGIVGLAAPAAGILVAIHHPPMLPQGEPAQSEGDILRCGASWRERIGDARGGMWHLHLRGDPAQLGHAHGALIGDLAQSLEGAMIRQFTTLVPSFAARHLLLGLVGFNGCTLPDYFRADEITEIAACAAAMDAGYSSFRSSLPRYDRKLQYHALHDISHTLIDNPLVAVPRLGCTALALGGSRTGDGRVLVGRLFDFEGGEAFDRDKVVMTVEPTGGIAFVSVAWAGLTGAVTGMNDAGLWVSINAGASAGQGTVGRPIIMAAREILQGCRTIAEAVTVLERTPVFVSESVLIASGPQRRAVSVEIGPTGLALREMEDGLLVLANHFRCERWQGDAVNAQRIAEGTSTRRYARVEELARSLAVHTPQSVLDLLRDRCTPGGGDVGFGNRGTINSWIGAHLAVADLEAKVMWVAAPSHGLGAAWAFTPHGPQAQPPLAAAPDLALHDRDAEAWEAALATGRRALAAGELAAATQAAATALALNPRNYESLELAGLASWEPSERERLLRLALEREPAYPAERRRIVAELGQAPPAPSAEIPASSAP